MNRVIFGECSPSRSQKYYKRMLTSIQSIRTVLYNQLQSCHQTPDSLCLGTKTSRKKTNTPRSRANTPPLRSSTLKHKENQQSTFSQLKSTIPFSTKQESSLYSTPHKKKGGSNLNSPYAQFQSPFEECIFDKAETVRKAKGERSQLQQRSSSRRIKMKDPQISLQESRWFKWHLSATKGVCENKKKYDKENVKTQLKVKYTKAFPQKQDTFGGFGDVSRLQRQFESCVLRKKGAVLEEQAALRGKMTELSYRIAKIKEQQTRLCLDRS